MPAPLVIPQSVNYSSPLIGRPARWRHEPREGDRVISAGISWGSANDGGPNNCVEVNCGQVQVNPLSQIAALYVNNLGSDADVSFLFISSQFQLTVPARSEGLFPVEASDTRFYASAPGAAASDVTYFQIYNSLPPPVAIAKTDFVSAGQGAGMALSTGTNPILAGKSGILTGFQVNVSNVLAGAGAGSVIIDIEDGSATPVVFAIAQLGFQNGQFVSFNQILQMTGLVLRFFNGITFRTVYTGTALVSGSLFADVYYR